jgi:capsular polysaccharide biosynthesis protein
MKYKRNALNNEAIRKSAKLCELQDALVIPLQPDSNPGNVKGGVKNQTLATSFHQHRWEVIHSAKSGLELATDLVFLNKTAETSKYIKGCYLFGGPLFSNFGHFLAECIHRLWAFEYQSKVNEIYFDGVVILPQCAEKPGLLRRITYQLPPVFIETLNYLGIPKSKIKYQFSAVTYEQLHVPQQASYFRSQIPIGQEYKAFLSRCERRNGINGSIAGYQNVYVSRTNFSLKGAIAGESYLESFLERNEFHIFYPENHSIVEQLQTYKSAKEIVFAEGGALHVLELLGDIAANIYVIARRPKSQRVFTAMLEARAKNFTFFTSVVTLPSLFVPEQSDKTAHGSAISVVAIDALVTFLQNSLQVDIAKFVLGDFTAAVERDLQGYYDYYKELTPGNESTKKIAMEKYQKQVNSMEGYSNLKLDG